MWGKGKIMKANMIRYIRNAQLSNLLRHNIM
jgi:hypothetical protein